MQESYFKIYSESLKRDMEHKVYGTGGMAVLAIPSQDGRFFDWENFGMVEVLRQQIEDGRLRLITCDTIDAETWSNRAGDSYYRIRRHEAWFNYVIDELLPAVRLHEGETFLVTGCSMGAYHAANFFFRRPDLFHGLIAMSGLYHSDYGFPNYNDELTYANSPISFIAGMPADHPWIRLYNDRKAIICVGQGRWEDELLDSTRRLDTVCCQKGIKVKFDYWGFDVDHDWPWWRTQLSHFIQQFV